jgi:hypothetical protein
MTMDNVDHTNPHTGESFGQTQTFRRGAVVAADGGEPEPDETEPEAGPRTDATGDAMRDVNHEPPSEGANRTFERGTEGRTDTV